MFDYLRDPQEIYRQSFATIEAEADLARFPEELRYGSFMPVAWLKREI